MIDIAFALLAGILTIAAPCILPVLPILLGASIGQTARARPFFIALGFVVTFSAFALLFTLFSDALGLTATTLRDAAIVLLLTFGVLMLWKRPLQWAAQKMSGPLNRVDRIGARAGAGNAGGLLLGMTLGLVWTPCAGPVFGSILTLLASAHNLRRAGILLVSYAVGAGLPMLLIAYGGQYISGRVRLIARYLTRVQQAAGVVIILIALAMLADYDTLIAAWAADFLPNLSQGL